MARTFVPSKRIKNAHRRSRSGLSLKTFARREARTGWEHLTIEAAFAWLDSKGQGAVCR